VGAIFRRGLTLFGYFETDDLEKTVAALAHDPVNARWSQPMAPLMKIEIDQGAGFPFLLPKRWRMD
jgi:L-rhamnose mutarotase